jgi:phosphate transport system substrate-binding protein
MKTSRCTIWLLGMKPRLPTGLGLLALGLLLTGCPATKPEQDLEQKPAGIVIRGSNTVGEELAPRLIAEYKKEHPHAVFDHEFKGTSYGIGALLVGRCDIAAASRELTTNEVELAKMHDIDLNGYVIGSYAVAVIVHADNPVKDLSPDQVRDIFTGTITNWKDVGGPDAPIHLHIRDPISGTFLGFQELAMEKKPYGSGLKTYTDYESIVHAVAKDPHGIGYAGLDGAPKAGVHLVSIGGVAANAANVNLGSYPYARVLRLYTDKARESAAAREFIQFVLSPAGQKVVTELGFVPRS